MNLKDYYKQRLMEELNESRQTEARRLTAMIGKGRPRETAGSDPTRISLAGLGSGTDPRNRAKTREMLSAIESGNFNRAYAIGTASQARTLKAYQTLGTSAHY